MSFFMNATDVLWLIPGPLGQTLFFPLGGGGLEHDELKQ